ncbi:MAG: hypothetical protein KBD19_00795 [Candidatus Moranbacteria bacterium]|nr:hypothetical protein [Candidatus Moranbacteria bacterium]
MTLGAGAQYKLGRLGVNSNVAPINALEVGGGGNALIGGNAYVSGSVGIGTAAPTAYLHVQKPYDPGTPLFIATNSSNDNGFRVGGLGLTSLGNHAASDGSPAAWLNVKAESSVGKPLILGTNDGADRFRVGGAGKVEAFGASADFCLDRGSGATCLSTVGGGGGSGTVTSVGTGSGLTGGPITGTGTIGINTTGISTCTGGSQNIVWDASNSRFKCETDDTGVKSFSCPSGQVVSGFDASGNPICVSHVSSPLKGYSMGWDVTNSLYYISVRTPAGFLSPRCGCDTRIENLPSGTGTTDCGVVATSNGKGTAVAGGKFGFHQADVGPVCYDQIHAPFSNGNRSIPYYRLD